MNEKFQIKNLIEDKYFNIQVIVFLMLQPFINMFRTFFESSVQLFGISLPELINLFLIVYLLFLFFIKYFREKKVIIPLVIYLAVTAIYTVFHLWNILNFNQNILTSTDINIFKETYYILRTYLVPIMFFYILLNCKIENATFLKVTEILSWIISGNIVITNLFKISFISYASSLEKNQFVEKNIIEWFTTSGTKKPILMTSKGWFYMGNQIGMVLFILFPFTVLLFLKNKSIKNFILVLLNIIAMIMVGTRVASVGALLILIATVFIVILFAWVLKQFKFTLKNVVAFLSLLLIGVFLFLYSPTINIAADRKQAFDTTPIDQEIDIEDELAEFNDFEDSTTDAFEQVFGHPCTYFGIDTEFVELLDLKENIKFWEKTITNSDKSQIEYRRFKSLIYEEVLKKNDNPADRWLGIGYTSYFPYTERDFVAQNIWFGYIGTFLLIFPYIAYLIYALIVLLRKLKSRFTYENAIFAISLVGSLLLCFMAGHLFFDVFSSVIFVWVLSAFCRRQYSLEE